MSLAHASITDLVTGGIVVVGAAMTLPVYWWLFITPLIRLLKRIGKTGKDNLI